MKTKSLILNFCYFLLLLSACKENADPAIIEGNGQYQYTTDAKKAIVGPMTPDSTFYVETDIEDLKNIIKNEISDVENVSAEKVSLSTLNVRSVVVFPEIITGETPAYLALAESRFRVKSINTNLETDYVELAIFNAGESSESVMNYEVLDEDLLVLNPSGFAPFDFVFQWNGQLESSEILADIEIIFEYEYELEN